jgi:hypothetical protein
MCDIGPPGYSYCTYAPDKTCYANGWPPCCSQKGGVNCPKDRPPCTIDALPAYCTYAPDTRCYQSGRPKCCNESNNLHVGETKDVHCYVFVVIDFSPNFCEYTLNLHVCNTQQMSSVPPYNPCVTLAHQALIIARMLLTKHVSPRAGHPAVLKTAV